MADIDLKTLTPDTSLPTTGFLFGADSQATASPSVYSTQAVATTLLGSTSLTGATLTADAPVLNLAQTWNSSGVTFTGMKFNAAGTSDANSAAASLLMDLQVGAVSKFNVTKTGAAYGTLIGSTTATFGISATTGIGFFSSNRMSVLADGQVAMFFGSNQNVVANGRSLSFESAASGAGDTFITRKNIRIIQLGAADAATALAQTLSVQSVVGGTVGNIAGQDFTINGSQGVGSGAGGNIIFQTAPAGTAGATTQNALAAVLTLTKDTVVVNQGFLQLGTVSTNYFRSISGTATNFNGVLGATSLGVTSSPGTSADVFLTRDDPNILAQRNSTTAQAFRVYKTYSDASNYERGVFDWTTTAGVLTIGTQKLGSGAARPLELQTDGTAVLTLATDGSVTQSGTYFKLNNRGGSCQVWIGSESTVSAFIGTITSTPLALRANNTAWLTISTTGLLQLQGATSSFPALKRSTTFLQARLADDSAFTNIQGKLTTDNAYAAGGVLAATGSITIYDSTGTAYRVPCLV